MRRTFAAIVLAGAAQIAFAESKAWQDTIALPTWLEGAPNIYPKLDALDPEHSFYPYSERKNFTDARKSQAWRRLNLENEYLTCSFLPDLGGHLYTCVDKRNGHPLFRANESIKKADVGPRGAWIATGVEFNFPVAHSRDTVSSVDFGFRQEKDRAEVWLGDTDRVTGMRWLVEFTLRDGSAVLEQRVTLSNPTAARHPYLWWANADIELNPATRFIYPANVMGEDGFTRLYSWPRDEKGNDLSKPFTIARQTGLFAYGSREPFVAAYDSGTRTATVHVADPDVVTGKKLFYWGTGDSPWASEHLSDNNSVYVELQAGLFGTQAIHEFLQPGSETQFTELWMAARDLDTVSRANQHAILSLRRDTEKNQLLAQVNVTHAIPGARIALYKGSSAVWQDTANLSPDRSYEHAFPNPETGVTYRFELRDAEGHPLLVHTEGVYEAIASASVKLGPQRSQDPSFKRDSAAACLASGQYNEKKSLYVFAESDYRDCLKKFADDVQLEKALGRLLATKGRYSEASDWLAKASHKLVLDAELRYYLGLSLASLGKPDEARASWKISAPDREFGPASVFEMAVLEARAGRPAAALSLAKQALDRHPSLLEARKLEVALLRRSGAMEPARKECDVALALDPIDAFLRLESTKLGAKDDSLWVHLGADPKRVLAIADSYIQLGLYEDALELLKHRYEAVPSNQTEPGATLPQDNALVSYYRGFLESKLGRDPTADFKLASTQSLAYVFPHGVTAESVLAAAVKYDPKDAAALFLTGLIYLDQNRLAEAANELSAAMAIRKNLPAIHELLGRTLLRLPDKKSEALAVLNEGVAANPEDKEIKAALQNAVHAPAATAASESVALATAPAMKKPETPLEFAMSALTQAAEGKPQISLFNAHTFPESTQPPAVLQAYVEVQLQAIRLRAAKEDCATLLTDVDSIGAGDPALPFTMRGLGQYTSGARFQYYLGAVESLCGFSKDGKRRWTKVAKMTPAIDSPDFAFPAIAAQSLGKSDSIDWNALLEKISTALGGSPESRSVLDFSRGILLLAQGQERDAIASFTAGANSPQRDFGWYLDRLALVEANHAAPRK